MDGERGARGGDTERIHQVGETQAATRVNNEYVSLAYFLHLKNFANRKK